MKPIHTLSLLALAGICPLVTTSALAQEAGFPYWGLSVGRAHDKFDGAQITRDQTGLPVTSVNSDDKDTAYKLFGGYQINRNFGMELGYFDLGKFSFDSTVPGGTLHGETRLRGINLDLVGTAPLSERFAVTARIGANFARSRDNFATTGTATVPDPSPSKRDTNYKVGVGLQYELSPAIWLRGDAERYRINGAVNNHSNLNLYSVSLVFPFGRAESPRPRAAAEPVYVPPVAAAPMPPVAMAPPAPAPVMAMAAPTPPPVPQRVSFSAESLFGFDKSVVLPEGQAALDSFSKNLAGTSYDRITVEGHTDRLGTMVYNQKLSEERAEAVKAYLVSSGGLDAQKITAVGKSESMPVTKSEDCKGSKPSSALIACLQPDRRVEIEVTGTR